MTDPNCRIGKVTPKGNLVLLPKKYDPLSTPANTILRQMKDKLNDVLVIGYDKDGCLHYNANASGNECLFMMEYVKKQMMPK